MDDRSSPVFSIYRLRLYICGAKDRVYANDTAFYELNGRGAA